MTAPSPLQQVQQQQQGQSAFSPLPASNAPTHFHGGAQPSQAQTASEPLNIAKDGRLGLAGFIYLDESGDTGFKFNRGLTHYFVVTLMLVSDQIPMQNAIDDLRKELHFSEDTEFKFSKSSNTVRHKFFTTLRWLDFSAYSIVIDKFDFMEYRELGHAQLYRAVIEQVLNHCSALFDDATLVVDESIKNKRRQQALATFLRSALNIDASAPKLGKIVHHQSHRDNLLQAVDMLSGAVNAWCSKSDNTHLAALKPKTIHIIEI